MKQFKNVTFKLLAAVLILAISLLAACTPTPAVPFYTCHATGDPANPYVVVTVTSENLEEYLGYTTDIYPVPEAGCPTSQVEITNGKITICHATSSQTNPYNEISISVQGLNGHGDHVGDIIPAPAGGCPDTQLQTNQGKITICHNTSSDKNPYNEITVSINGLNGHDKHDGDIIPVPAGGCPTTSP